MSSNTRHPKPPTALQLCPTHSHRHQKAQLLSMATCIATPHRRRGSTWNWSATSAIWSISALERSELRMRKVPVSTDLGSPARILTGSPTSTMSLCTRVRMAECCTSPEKHAFLGQSLVVKGRALRPVAKHRGQAHLGPCRTEIEADSDTALQEEACSRLNDHSSSLRRLQCPRQSMVATGRHALNV